MGAKRFEMRLTEGYFKARLRAIEQERAALDARAFIDAKQEARREFLDGAEAEARSFLEFFGAYD